MCRHDHRLDNRLDPAFRQAQRCQRATGQCNLQNASAIGCHRLNPPGASDAPTQKFTNLPVNGTRVQGIPQVKVVSLMDIFFA